MATVNISLNKFRIKQDKTYPVVFIIRNNGKAAHISTGISVEEKYWDDTKMLKKGANNVLDTILHSVNNYDL